MYSYALSQLLWSFAWKMTDHAHSNQDCFCYSPCLVENYHRQLTSSPMMAIWQQERSNFFSNFGASLASNSKLTCAEGGSLASTDPGQLIHLLIFH